MTSMIPSTDQLSIPESDSDLDTGGGWHPGLHPSDEVRLAQARRDKSAIVEEIPTEKAGLGWYSVSCLLLNRMIGSGVFNSSSVIFHNTQSVGISLMIWFIGAVVALSGVVLYIELGLTIPRYQLGEGKEKTPIVRSGGELPYLNYFFKRPKFFATCIFGISFILLFGNTATNSVAFAVAVLEASGAKQDAGRVAGIAIAVNAFSCLLHSMSRKWGVRLNNFLGTFKLTMLLIMTIFGFIWLGKDNSVGAANFDTKTSFPTANSPRGVYRYAEAAIFAIFPFGGFHQANYVLAEIKHPRRNFAITSLSTVLVVCCLFVTISALYAAVIPPQILFLPDHDQAYEFFRHTIGTRLTARQTESVSGSFRALSALGNVIVFTFTAARVKQEVAKEGVLPFSLFFASSYSFSWRLGRDFGFRRLPSESRAGYQLHSSRAPAAALGLHWGVTCVLILAVVFGTSSSRTGGGNGGGFDHVPAYYLLITAYAYGLDVFWFSVIGVGMLCLRLWPGSTWRYKSPVPHSVGIVAAVLFTVTNGFPLIAIWVADPAERFLSKSKGIVPWFASQTTAFCVLAASALYWSGFRAYLYLKKTKDGVELEVVRNPIFWRDPSSVGYAKSSKSIFPFGGKKKRGLEDQGDDAGGELVQIYEIIKLRWRAYNRKDESRRISKATEMTVVTSLQDPAEGKGVARLSPGPTRGVETWRMSGGM